MYRFWSYITRPILKLTQPEIIIEVGAADGKNTRNLLDFCRETGGLLISIDPAPNFPVASWQSEYTHHFQFIRETSLNSLSKIEKMDAVLIDGDHNWYTVYNELQIINERCRFFDHSFPVVLFHDIGWPYAYRDLYYAPENIPNEYLKPYSRKGLDINNSKLKERGGLNPDLFNANDEFLPQSGVLTAIEDFIQSAGREFEFFQIPGFHGFGVLLEKSLLSRNKGLRLFLDNIAHNLFNDGYVAALETNRLELAVSRSDLFYKISELENELSQKSLLFQGKQDEFLKKISVLSDSFSEKERELSLTQAMLKDKEKALEKFKSEIKFRDSQIAQLESWIKNSNVAFNALTQSNRWKLGNTLGELSLRLRGKPREPLMTDYLQTIFSQFQNWQNKRTQQLQLVEKPKISVSHLRVDIVICVHNAINDVKACLESVQRNTDKRHQLILIDDGSQQVCQAYLSEFKKNNPTVVLIRNDSPQGYTLAANQGLRASTAQYVVLLNSDTIVPADWLERLLACAENDARLGIVGPLSNAASWQSVPDLFDSQGDWAINSLPKGWTVDRMDLLIQNISKCTFPRVPLLNGFCILLKRHLIETIGYLDEENFPEGYGEENDYCLRAGNAGFHLAIADNVFVFHAKSKSYSHERRRLLSKKSQESLEKKYGKEKIESSVFALRKEKLLEEIRRQIKSAITLSQKAQAPLALDTDEKVFSVLFLLPVSGLGGGIHSVVQEASAMREMGVNVQIAVPSSSIDEYRNNYPNLNSFSDLFLAFKNVNELKIQASRFDVVIATIYHSVALLKKIIVDNPYILPAYYIQDYEPWFFESGSSKWQEACASYTLIPNMLLFAKTRWLCDVVGEKHNVSVEKVVPSLDHSIYYANFSNIQEVDWPIHIAAMIRPSSPRRAAHRTMKLLKILKEAYGPRIEIHTFGCHDNDFVDYQLISDFEFKNHGELVREDVAKVLRGANIFVDFSDFQAFGRTAIEAMACGCAVVLPSFGGTSDFAVNEQNSLIVDTKNEQQCLMAVDQLINQPALRRSLATNALKCVDEFSLIGAAKSEIMLFRNRFNEYQKHNINYIANKTTKKHALQVMGILSTTNKGFVGSAYIRLIQPLRHPTIAEKINFEVTSLPDVYQNNPDIVVVQRIAVSKEQDAKDLVSYCRARNIKLIYEIDDHLFEISREGSMHPEADKYAQWTRGARILALNADLVTVSSEYLKSEISTFNPSVRVLVNALDEQVWFLSQDNQQVKSVEGKIGILYMGTKTHDQDLLMIESALRQLYEKYGNRICIDIIGVSSSKLGLNFINYVDTPVEDVEYPQFVKWLQGQSSRWSIGLAPLVDTSFNQAKSYIKYLDYSALGLASICSNVKPYHSVIENNINGLLVNATTLDWVNAVSKLIDDDLLRQNLSHNAYKDLMTKHILSIKAKDWQDSYLHLLVADHKGAASAKISKKPSR